MTRAEDRPAREVTDLQAESAASRPLPSWLLRSEDYEPERDHDGFIRKTILSLMGVLSRMRLDDGQAARFSPSAPLKLAGGLVLILLTSLSSNYAFVLIILGAVLLREALLPIGALKRCIATSLAATALTALVMLPAILLGQSHAPLLIATKVLATTGIAMTVALSTPARELTGALKTFHIPDEAIMTVELALKGIVDLGQVALEVLQALRLRSVGRNDRKASSAGGVAGVTFLKAHKAAESTAAAMRCRGFEGEYAPCPPAHHHASDIAWLAALAAAVALFVYLEGAV